MRGGLRSAFVVAVVLCVGASLARYVGAPVPNSTQRPRPADLTPAFHDFAMVGQRFPPEWLVRVKRVYSTGTGALWADATMPGRRPGRVFTIEAICGALSDYVARHGWRGVSVRTLAGAELLTREKPADTCRLPR